ncbi:hypothetical protein B0H11DRAFT_1931156 [Mycena galericulata]|nr:hypothetical protein B0H11DRAFT_1931156 [Mycena galericulata]
MLEKSSDTWKFLVVFPLIENKRPVCAYRANGGQHKFFSRVLVASAMSCFPFYTYETYPFLLEPFTCYRSPRAWPVGCWVCSRELRTIIWMLGVRTAFVMMFESNREEHDGSVPHPNEKYIIGLVRRGREGIPMQGRNWRVKFQAENRRRQELPARLLVNIFGENHFDSVKQELGMKPRQELGLKSSGYELGVRRMRRERKLSKDRHPRDLAFE